MKNFLFILLLLAGVCTESRAQSYSYRLQNFDDKDIGIEFGYVNKQYVTKFPGKKTLHEDLFGNRDRFLHGMQLGAIYQPISEKGIGMKTGLYGEVYFASGRNMGYDFFTEANLYVPLDVVYRAPITDKLAISAMGGISMNLILYGELSDARSGYMGAYETDSFLGSIVMGTFDYYYSRFDTSSIDYGNNGWPRRFNGQYEFGGVVTYGDFFIKAMYSRGLTNHKFYWTDRDRHITRDRKLMVTFGILM